MLDYSVYKTQWYAMLPIYKLDIITGPRGFCCIVLEQIDKIDKK